MNGSSLPRFSLPIKLICTLSGLLLLASFGAAAQYPERPIRLVVGFSPGGAADVSARLITRRMAEYMSATFVIDNRPGAGGNVAAQTVATANPDGYTLFWGSVGPLTVSPAMGVKLPYDPIAAFTPVSLAVKSCNVLVARPGFPANSIGDLITLARTKPGEFNYGSQGIGSTGHLAGELLKGLTRTDIVHIGYKGGAQVVTSLLGGEISLAFVSVTGLRSLGARAKALAITCDRRDPGLPAVPTFAESGIKDYDATFWYGLLAPARTPPLVISRLNTALRSAVSDPAVAQPLERQGLTVAPTSPGEFGDLIRMDYAKWMKVFEGKQP